MRDLPQKHKVTFSPTPGLREPCGREGKRNVRAGGSTSAVRCWFPDRAAVHLQQLWDAWKTKATRSARVPAGLQNGFKNEMQEGRKKRGRKKEGRREGGGSKGGGREGEDGGRRE